MSDFAKNLRSNVFCRLPLFYVAVPNSGSTETGYVDSWNKESTLQKGNVSVIIQLLYQISFSSFNSLHKFTCNHLRLDGVTRILERHSVPTLITLLMMYLRLALANTYLCSFLH